MQIAEDIRADHNRRNCSEFRRNLGQRLVKHWSLVRFTDRVKLREKRLITQYIPSHVQLAVFLRRFYRLLIGSRTHLQTIFLCDFNIVRRQLRSNVDGRDWSSLDDDFDPSDPLAGGGDDEHRELRCGSSVGG